MTQKLIHKLVFLYFIMTDYYVIVITMPQDEPYIFLFQMFL